MSLHSQDLGRSVVWTIQLAANWFPSLATWVRTTAERYAEGALNAYSHGDLELSEAEYRKAVVWQPHNADFHSALGQVCYEQGQVEKAEEQFRKALDYDYRNLRALKGLAVILQERDDLREAMYLYLKYLELNPKDAVACQNLGVVFYDLGNCEEAIEYYRRAEEEDPDDPLVRRNHALALLALGRHEEAQATLLRARAIAPQDAETDLLLASILGDQGKTSLALEYYESATRKDPDNPDIRLEFASFASRSGRHQESIEHANAAIKLFRQGGDEEGISKAYWELGWSYYMLGDWDNSIRASTEALKLDPGLTPVRFNLALAFLESGCIAEARKAYEEGISRLTQLTDLKIHAIDDLRAALDRKPQLNGGAEILAMLEDKYKTLSKDLTRATDQPNTRVVSS